MRESRFSYRATLAATIVSAAVLASGCSSNQWGFPYKVGVQQGNWITTDQVGLLSEGMTREQVRFALGSPTLTSALHADRWDYPYFYRASNGEIEERNFTVFFRNGLLVKWQGDEQPTVQPFQIAEETVDREKDEQAELNLARERVEAATGQQTIEPGIDFSTITNAPDSADPGALPDEPDATPQEMM
ncbi:MAG: outer membrane protein assembly factor BamE [Burkholderiaceae bacterium]|nr:outer membrane protein assembly factor BamE [Burkholderiaceae bacterium]MCD8516209.1 outer membrane protein assembly factor BamE [Burkholderiaceae bacterium]MCD8566215.1 outer membrane protein assembly factor BamE [Burkholderiaceae bacterium]